MSLPESTAVKPAARATDLGTLEDYIVLEQNPDGTVLLGPDTSVSAMERRLKMEPISDEDARRLLDELRPQMLPPDDEG